ncbi:hypothetical protein GJ496_011905, partial [Pomphorhynchus laevis]
LTKSLEHTDSAHELFEGSSALMHCIAGYMAGTAEHGLMYPVDFAKTRLMSIRSAVQTISGSIVNAVRKEGLLRPMRGISIVAISAGPAHGLYYAGYEFTKHSLTDNMRSSGKNYIANGSAAIVATLLHDFVMVPADTLKQQIQKENSQHRNLVKCFQKIVKTEGISDRALCYLRASKRFAMWRKL